MWKLLQNDLSKMTTKESIVLTRWIKKVGVDEFGFFDSKENPCHIINYVDAQSAPYLDRVLPLCTQVFIESADLCYSQPLLRGPVYKQLSIECLSERDPNRPEMHSERTETALRISDMKSAIHVS